MYKLTIKDGTTYYSSLDKANINEDDITEFDTLLSALSHLFYALEDYPNNKTTFVFNPVKFEKLKKKKGRK